MTDALGPRMKFGVLAPSVNTSVQPEYDALSPPGVTNHHARILVPERPVRDDADFTRLVADVLDETMNAVDRVMTCSPGAIVMGMSSETFLPGLAGAADMERRVAERAGVPVTTGGDALIAALGLFGARRIACITPYMPVGDARVREFFTEAGFEVADVLGLRRPSPQQIAHTTAREIRDAFLAVDGAQVDALVQVGTNLAAGRVAAMAEFWLDKPVLAINVATYWRALRQNGLADRRDGWGALMRDH